MIGEGRAIRNQRDARGFVQQLRFWTGLAVILFGVLCGASHGMLAAGATLEGTVTDVSRAVIPGVELLLSSLDGQTQTSLVSDDLGTFSITGLPAGSYRLTAVLPGFEDAVLDGLSLQEGEKLHVEVVLKIVPVTSEVVVADSRPQVTGVAAAITPLAVPDSMSRPPEPELRRPTRGLFVRGRVYSDWLGSKTEAGFSHQLSNRLKLEIGAPPGEGWTIRLDLRDRHRMGASSGTRLVMYDARLTFDSQENPLFLSIGQMNLYDTAGIGQLLGAIAGYKPAPRLLVGGYVGYNPDIFDFRLDPDYKKFGVFARYLGPRATTLSVSFNNLSFQGESERRFLYLNGLAAVTDRAIVYGNVEYELGSNIGTNDRLSRLFFNTRLDVTSNIDLTTSFSLGRGLDYHQYLLEQSQELGANNGSLERFYFSTQYGARLRFKLPHRIHFTVGQRVADDQDKQIQNHTTQLILAAQDIAGSGLSLNAGYNINRGDRSESNALYLSASRTFGRFSWNTSYSSSFNSVRFDATTGLPRLIHIDNLHTISNDVFWALSRSVGLSFQYEHSLGRSVEDLFLFRFIYRM